jgi:hypothetical protein
MPSIEVFEVLKYCAHDLIDHRRIQIGPRNQCRQQPERRDRLAQRRIGVLVDSCERLVGESLDQTVEVSSCT